MRTRVSDKSINDSWRALNALEEFTKNDVEVFIVNECLTLHLKSNDKGERLSEV